MEFIFGKMKEQKKLRTKSNEMCGTSDKREEQMHIQNTKSD